jgi:hypothetical protein
LVSRGVVSDEQLTKQIESVRRRQEAGA